MILTPKEMQAAEEAVFAQGAVAEDLMETAGLGIAHALRERFPQPGHAVAYLGKGHNAGDALVVGRYLRRWGWTVSLRDVGDPRECSPLTRKKRAEFLGEALPTPQSEAPNRPLLLLDGLLGIGASGPLRGRFQELAQEMNRRRQEEHAWTIAIDLPTGLNGETGEAVEGAVEADLTLTIAFAKTGLLADTAEAHVGALSIVSLPDILPPATGGDRKAGVLTAKSLRPFYRRRPVSDYKNRAGHVALLAGSRGFTGAAAMAAEGALAAGAGLVSLYVPESIYPILATRCVPEIMVQVLPANLTPDDLTDLPATVFAMGPGLGSSPDPALLDWLQRESRPVVIDADGLNLMACHPDRHASIAAAGPRLLTPHPGEFARLFPDENTLATRRERAESATKRLPLTLLYKGTRSIVSQNGQPTQFNLSGNQGMASGGMGDVLTGVCAGLAAQGHALAEAAAMGAWLCGRAAEVAVQNGETFETLRASMVIAHLAAAFRDLA